MDVRQQRAPHIVHLKTRCYKPRTFLQSQLIIHTFFQCGSQQQASSPKEHSPTMSPGHIEAVVAWNHLLDGHQSNYRNHRSRTLFITPENQLSNTPVFDSMDRKADTTTRLYFQNVNGLKFDRNGRDFEEVCHTANDTQSDIMCIAEHNLDTTQYYVMSTLTQTQNSICRRSRLTASSLTITTKGTYKPGSTLMLSSGNITS